MMSLGLRERLVFLVKYRVIMTQLIYKFTTDFKNTPNFNKRMCNIKDSTKCNIYIYIIMSLNRMRFDQLILCFFNFIYRFIYHKY